jgi:hypothetical protein
VFPPRARLASPVLSRALPPSRSFAFSCAPACSRAAPLYLLSCTQLQHFAYSRDEVKALAFWNMMTSCYSMDQILVADETSKDRRRLRQSMGWGVRGGVTYTFDTFPNRGARVSALALLSTRGFEDWRYDNGNFCSVSFVQAMRDMLLTPRANGTKLADDFAVLLLDNASIHHKDAEFIRELGLYIRVLFIPPYCYHLSPLDNGAFGWVVRFLQANNNAYGHQSIRVGLDAAFLAMQPATARYCFHNCKYV